MGGVPSVAAMPLRIANAPNSWGIEPAASLRHLRAVGLAG